MLSRVLTDELRNKIVNTLFYIALTIELVLMIVEKSELSFGYESHVFRVTFLLTLIAAALVKRDKKEWFVIGALIVFTFACYRLSGRNELLRIVVFMMAARDIDLKKAMKYSFFVCLSGFLLIALLSLPGILGQVVQVADYGRGIADESRLVLGFGHPNTLFGSVYVLVLMWLWIYGAKASIYSHVVVILISFMFATLTKTRTGMLVLAMTLVLALIIKFAKGLKNVAAVYVLEAIVTPCLCVLTAVLAAGYSGYGYIKQGIKTPAFFWKLDSVLNNRISSLYYEAPEHGAILVNWKLFAGRGADGYFDLGWVRLFYWYGILPTALIAVGVLCVIYVCYKKKDLWTLLIILSVSVYTIIEATFVTRYIGRCFYLLIAGVYLGYLLKGKFDD